MDLAFHVIRCVRIADANQANVQLTHARPTCTLFSPNRTFDSRSRRLVHSPDGCVSTAQLDMRRPSRRDVFLFCLSFTCTENQSGRGLTGRWSRATWTTGLISPVVYVSLGAFEHHCRQKRETKKQIVFFAAREVLD